METLGLVGWREVAREEAKKIKKSIELNEFKKESIIEISEMIVQENLNYFGVEREDWKKSITAIALDLKGWAGMFVNSFAFLINKKSLKEIEKDGNTSQ